MNESLNFNLPANWITDGAVHFEIALDVDGSPTSPVAIPCDGCDNTYFNERPVFVRFVQMPTLRLRIVGLQFAAGTPPVMHAPRSQDFSLLRSWVQRAFPAGNFDISTNMVTSNQPFPFTCNNSNAQLSAIRESEIGTGGKNPLTHYVALVINTAGFMRGCTSGDPPDNPDTTVVASTPTGDTASGPRPSGVVGDTDGSFGDWYGGHELAHQFGRKHPGFCDDNSDDDDDFPNENGQISDNLQTHVGVDMGDTLNGVSRRIISPFAFDIMTYCTQPQWFSAYTYLGVLQRLRAENGWPTLAQAVGPGTSITELSTSLPTEEMVGEFVSVVASVNLTRNAGAIRYVNHVARATVPAIQPNQIAAVQLRDKSGRVIKSFPTWVRADTDIPVGQDQTGLVQVIIPVVPSAAHVDLLLRGKLVSTRAISARAPVVTGLKLTTLKAQLGTRVERVLEWVGSDPDGDRLTYMVQIGGGPSRGRRLRSDCSRRNSHRRINSCNVRPIATFASLPMTV